MTCVRVLCVCVPFRAFVCVAAYRMRKEKEAGEVQTGIQDPDLKNKHKKCRSNLGMCDSYVLCFSATTVYY